MAEHLWIENIKNLSWNSLFVVTGTGGARTDLVTLWLAGSCSEFHDQYEWRIHPRNGSSNSSYPFVYNSNPDAVFSTLESNLPILLAGHNKDAIKSLICKSHQPPATIYEMTPIQLRKFVKIIAIETKYLSEEHLKKLQWEFVAKNWLDNSSTRSVDDLVTRYLADFPEQRGANYNDLICRSLRRVIQQRFRISSLENFCIRDQDRLPDNSSVFYLDYRKIIEPTGAEYILDVIGLEKNERAIQLWNIIFPSTNTPKVVDFRSTEWSLERILNS